MWGEKIAAEKKWLRDELTRLQSCDVYHEKAITLQALLIRHEGEWLVSIARRAVPLAI